MEQILVLLLVKMFPKFNLEPLSGMLNCSLRLVLELCCSLAE